MTQPEQTPAQKYPQDAPVGPAPSAPTLSTGQSPSAPPTPVREVTHLPAPGAPNWGLVLSGIVFMAIATGVILNQVNGFQFHELQQVGPTLLIVLGVGSALIGVVGLVARRGR